MATVWKVPRGGLRSVETLAEVETRLFSQRGITVESKDVFFNPVYERDIHDPGLLHDMDRAVSRIFQAMAARERIMVYGDYDVDGVTSTAMLITVLQQLGANVAPFLPHRFDDGYGLSAATVASLSSSFDLLITVDCGISSRAEVERLKVLGKDVIIIDHHEVPEDGVPGAVAVVHPRHPAGQYPFSWLCAAGVTWKVCQALLRDERFSGERDPDAEKWLLDLALLGTVADMVPLTGENRLVVQFGLEVLRRTRRPGLRALLASVCDDSAAVEIETLSWRVIPRLNAAGKMDHAQPALDLLLTNDTKQAERILEQLQSLNTDRQQKTTRVLEEALAQIEDVTSPFLFAYSTQWPAGVVGLVAGRLAQKFSRPAIVVGSNGRHAVGSARSPATANILELLRHGEQHALKLGGHARAAGFSVETDKIQLFYETLRTAPAALVNPSDSVVHEADSVLSPALAGWDLLRLQDQFSPFGEGNRQPRFIGRSMRLLDWRPVGKTGQHAKFVFEAGGETRDGIGFNVAERVPQGHGRVDVLFRVEANEFRGRRSVQLQVDDIAPAGAVTLEEHE